ncbi:MAG: primosomal protein N' [Alphaproteobacteria bacterium]|nr:primosomal protein N' [Alphaproteobacteria bacterium]
MQKVSVLLPTPFACCTYFSPVFLPVGTLVQVPFGRQKLVGVVWHGTPDDSFPEQKIKQIDNVVDLPPLTKQTCEFIEWVAQYTMTEPGLVLKMLLVPDLSVQSRQPVTFDEPKLDHTALTFSDEQKKAIKALKSQNEFGVTVLDGVTGSGKTEVYFEAIAHALAQGKQVLILLPEITLTQQWLARFEKRFGVLPACWHSDLTPKMRRDTWKAIDKGQVRVVVGARSALFLPFQKLGLIVVDEEHDPSYKQEDGVIYQARDMAIVRAKKENCPIILASATPSLETYVNIDRKHFQSVELKHRFYDVQMPKIEIVDMRQKEVKGKGMISLPLQQAMADNLAQHNQTLLFLNRRGYAPIRLCTACGEKIKCPHCSVFLTEHKAQKKLICHQCGYMRNIDTVCPSCHTENSLIACGAGVEKIAEEVKTLFPTARIEVVTSDTMSSPSHFQRILTALENQEIDVLIGTQMLAKGHHFKDLTLVGILDADFSLQGGDLRASERSFQLLQQVSGRAGRMHKSGRAFIQTYKPDNLVIQAMQQGDRAAFLTAEIDSRKALAMPPFGRLAALVVSGKNEKKTKEVALALQHAIPLFKGVEILGAVQAPLYVLRGKYRWRFLIKTQLKVDIQAVIKMWLSQIKCPASVSIKTDIDPYTFL